MFKIAAFADEADHQLAGQITAMHKNNISLLEMRNVNGTNVADLTCEEAREAKRQLDGEGIRVWSIGSPLGKIDIEDDFDAHLEQLRHVLEISSILGTNRIRMFSFYHANTPISDTLFKRVLTRLDKMLEVAEGTGIYLCHENEKGIYGDIADRCEALYQQLPKLHAVFDPANFIQCGENVLEAWDKLEKYVDYMHIKDVDANGCLVPAGQGLGNIPELLARYEKKGGEVMTLEPHLKVFAGLEKLEQNGEHIRHKNEYASSEEAFDAAANALKGIIEKM